MAVHLDTDFLIYALGTAGRERRRPLALADSGDVIQRSAVAWYEFSRGPRTPEQLAVARSFFPVTDGIVPLSEELATRMAEVSRLLGSPRKRAADIAIGVTAAALGASLLTRNKRDFAGMPDLALEAA